MACKPCEERRRMISAAYQSGGVKAVVKQAPTIAKHIIRNRPVIIRDRKP